MDVCCCIEASLLRNFSTFGGSFTTTACFHVNTSMPLSFMSLGLQIFQDCMYMYVSVNVKCVFSAETIGAEKLSHASL